MSNGHVKNVSSVSRYCQCQVYAWDYCYLKLVTGSADRLWECSIYSFHRAAYTCDPIIQTQFPHSNFQGEEVDFRQFLFPLPFKPPPLLTHTHKCTTSLRWIFERLIHWWQKQPLWNLHLVYFVGKKMCSNIWI